MQVTLTTIPTRYDGVVLRHKKEDDKPNENTGNPQDLRAILIECLSSAIDGFFDDGRPKPAGPDNLMKRMLLSVKLRDAEDVVDLETEELQLLETAVTAAKVPWAAIMVLEALHGKAKPPETEEGKSEEDSSE